MIRCNRCGQMIDDTSTFCPNCGQPVSQGQPAPQPNQQSQNNWQQQTPPNYNQQQKQAYYTAPNGMKVRNLEMLDACKMFWTKYAVFEGRSCRVLVGLSYGICDKLVVGLDLYRVVGLPDTDDCLERAPFARHRQERMVLLVDSYSYRWRDCADCVVVPRWQDRA